MNHFRISAAFILLILAAPVLHADDVDRYIMQGIDQMYGVQFDAAAQSFDKAIAAGRDDPRGYFYRANVHLWSYLFDKRQQQLDLFFSTNDKAIAVAEKRLAANGNDSRAKLFLGMAYGYKTIANARAENIMAAALSARTCHDKLNDLVRADPRAYDAYLGLGLFHFLLGSVPKAAQFVAGMSGIKGDAKLGIREIETAATRGTYFKNDAQLIIALLNIYYLNDLQKGMATLEGLARRYPRNVAMLYAIGTAYSMQNQPDRGLPYFERIIAQGNSDFKVITEMSVARAGMAWFMKNDVGRTKPYLQRYLKISSEKMYRAYIWYLLGLSFEIEGNRANALKAYDYAVKSPGVTPEDVASRRRATVRSKTPLSAADIAVLRTLNAATSSRFDEALTGANALIARRDLDAAQKAQAYHALGVALQGKGQYGKAIDAYKAAIGAGRHSETWVAPYSYMHIAECWLKLGDREKWRTNTDLARGYHDYDYEATLRFMLERDVTMID